MEWRKEEIIHKGSRRSKLTHLLFTCYLHEFSSRVNHEVWALLKSSHLKCWLLYINVLCSHFQHMNCTEHSEHRKQLKGENAYILTFLFLIFSVIWCRKPSFDPMVWKWTCLWWQAGAQMIQGYAFSLSSLWLN